MADPEVLGLPVNFNPRSREGSDDQIIRNTCFRHISIHAPVKGATGPSQFGTHHTNISIHAPVKGATHQ